VGASLWDMADDAMKAAMPDELRWLRESILWKQHYRLPRAEPTS
jgi:hypothetical protein